MNEYKSIREWIAESVETVGMVDADGYTLHGFTVKGGKTTSELVPSKGSDIKYVTLEHPVAPPKPKRLSDEELLDRLESVSARIPHHDPQFDESENAARRERNDLRSQILDRMKAKGPTRGEVRRRLYDLLEEHTRWVKGDENAYSPAHDTFLSMFPEGEQ